MEDVDTRDLGEYDDEDLFLRHVVGDEHEFLFLDSYLRESLGHVPRDGVGSIGNGEALGEENTI